MGAVEAVTSGALASALEAGRDRFNARIASARRLVHGFEPERFARRFAATARPAVDAVASVAPDRVQAVTNALFEVAIDLAGRGALGPAVVHMSDLAWTDALPAVAPLVAQSPDFVIRALANAVCNLALVPASRPRDWVARVAAAGPACATTHELLACGLVAAWTSGAAHFRSRALAALATLPAGAARAALDLPPNPVPVEPATLAARLDADPWLPPARAETAASGRSLEIVQTVGGFRGLGGAFMVPPGVALSDGRFVVSDSHAHAAWRLFADACGATLIRIDGRGPDGAAEAAGAFTLRSNGRVTIGSHDRTFPVLADAAGTAATDATLVVALPRSHDLFVLGLVPQ